VQRSAARRNLLAEGGLAQVPLGDKNQRGDIRDYFAAPEDEDSEEEDVEEKHAEQEDVVVHREEEKEVLEEKHAEQEDLPRLLAAEFAAVGDQGDDDQDDAGGERDDADRERDDADREHDAAARMPQENDQSDDDQGDAGGERDGDQSDEGEEHVNNSPAPKPRCDIRSFFSAPRGQKRKRS
jgi:hypothetical protein